jgi:hypothetical protein
MVTSGMTFTHCAYVVSALFSEQALSHAVRIHAIGKETCFRISTIAECLRQAALRNTMGVAVHDPDVRPLNNA